MAQLVIRQFDVFSTPKSRGSDAAPLVCVLQSHYFEALNTVLVAPLLLAVGVETPTQAAVPITFEGQRYLLDMSLTTNLTTRLLGRPRGSLAIYEDDIRRAFDRLLTGF